MESVLILGTGLTGRSVARYLKDKSNFNFFDTRPKEELSQIFIDNRDNGWYHCAELKEVNNDKR